MSIELGADFYPSPLVKINVPHFFADAEFVEWLNKRDNRIATWHEKGTPPDEYSDIFTTWDHGEGSDSDMPERIWKELCDFLEEHHVNHCLLWLTNLQQ